MTIGKHLSALVICLLTVFALGCLLPVTALAAAPSGQVIYVGDEAVTSDGYWTTDDSGNVTAYSGEGAPTDNYIHYDTANNTLTLHNATIKRELALNPDIPGGTIIAGAAIGVLNQSGNAELTIQLEGGNTIEDVSTGINVLAYSSSIGTARLTITGSGSLIASGSPYGILVQSNSNDATLDIQDTVVEATVDSSAGHGVKVQADDGKSASLSVGGGSLTATGGSSFGLGIYIYGPSSPENINLTVCNNAIVRANGGIASGANLEEDVSTSGTGIVFDDNEGTVYGSVELQENLTIGEGESLDIPNGASLTIPSGTTLTNEGTVANSGALTNNGTINNFGTLPDNIQGTAPPSITATSLDDGAENAAYTATLAADGEPTSWTWSADTNSSLPPGLALSTSGVIFGTPTTQGTYNFTVTATNSGGFDSKSLSITINPAANVPVESVSLNHTELSLTEGDIDTLTATVEPDNATDQNVIWSSSDNTVATVDENGKVTAVAAGTATITVTTVDQNKTATCTVTVTHGSMTLIPQKNASCTVEGKEAYYICETCGKYFSDAEGKTEISLADTVIPTTSHNYKDGKCTVCGDTDPNYQEPTSPTKDEPATEDSTKNTKDNTVTKSSTPQTSDALFGYAVFFVAIIVLASIVSVVAYRKLHTVQAKHSSSNKH